MKVVFPFYRASNVKFYHHVMLTYACSFGGIVYTAFLVPGLGGYTLVTFVL